MKLGSPVLAAAVLLAAARSAEAQYAASANTATGVVTFTGGAGNDTPLTFVNAAGVLTHNRADPGFNSFVDLDTTVAGDQMLMVSALTSLTINAGAGDDTVVLTGLTGVTAGTSVLVNGEDGNDVLTGGPADETFNGGAGDDLINPGAADGEANIVDGGAGTDSLVLAGDLGANVVAVGGTSAALSISIDGAASTAATSNLETVSAAGMDGDDAFTVAPLADLAYALDGGPGADTLNVNAGGNLILAQSASSLTVAGSLPIGHTAIETLNVTNEGSLLDNENARCGLLGLDALLLLGCAAIRRRRFETRRNA